MKVMAISVELPRVLVQLQAKVRHASPDAVHQPEHGPVSLCSSLNYVPGHHGGLNVGADQVDGNVNYFQVDL